MCKKCGCDNMVTINVNIDDNVLKTIKKKYKLRTNREVMAFCNGYIVGFYTDVKEKKECLR